LPYPNQSLKPIYMKLILLATFTFFLAGAQAQTPGIYASSNAHGRNCTAEVKFVPGMDGESFINVTCDNEAGDKFSVAIFDEYDNLLYQGYFTDKKLVKNFKIDDPETFGKLFFVIRDYADNSFQRFEVNSRSRLVEDVEIKEIQ
jgi:hypothetical protein